MCQHEASKEKLRMLMDVRNALAGRNGAKRVPAGSPAQKRLRAQEQELIEFLMQHEGWCDSEIDNRLMVIELRGAAAFAHI